MRNRDSLGVPQYNKNIEFNLRKYFLSPGLGEGKLPIHTNHKINLIKTGKFNIRCPFPA